MNEEKRKIAEKIFSDIDEIIKRNLNQRPIVFERSKFKQEYDEYKEETLK